MTEDIHAQIAKQEENLARAEQENDLEAKLASWDKLGHLYRNQGDYTRSLHAYEEAAKIANKVKDAHCLLSLGISLGILHEYDQSLECLKQSIQISLSHEDTELDAIKALYILADKYKTSLHDIPQAVIYYQQALELAQKIKNTEYQYWNLQALGGCSEKVGDNQQAIHYYEQGLAVVRGDKDKAKEASLLTDIAHIYAAKGDQAQMTAYFEQALSVAQTSDDLDAILHVLIWWGHAYSKLGEQAKALDRYQKALDIARNQGDAEPQRRCLSTLAHYYEKREDWPQAIDTYQQILKLTNTYSDDSLPDNWKKSQLDFDQTVALTSLGEIYEEIGEIPQALDYMEQALASTTIRSTVWKLDEYITRLKQKLNPATTTDAGDS